MRLKVDSWHRLVAVARAADPDPWRNAIRDQFDRPTSDSLPVLKARAGDAQALEKQPANSLLLLSLMLEDDNDRPAAAAVLQVARRRFPKDFWVWLTQGNLDTEGAPQPDPAAAERSLATAVSLRPQSALAHSNLAVVLHRQGKIADATRALDAAIRLKPQSAEGQLALGYAFAETGKLDLAIAAYRDAIRLKPGDAEAHSTLGNALVQHQRGDHRLPRSDSPETRLRGGPLCLPYRPACKWQGS